jgi:ABC-type transport system substrate-binding protein/tRNA A-37 threonylcarbamoyl transferase component Bud32
MEGPPVVAGYRLIELIGRGATGSVYRAERSGSDEVVALKLLAPELADDERSRRRLLRESAIAADLDHPSVVPILDFGEVDGTVYLAMRLVEGSDLRAILAREAPLSPDRTLQLLAPVAEALDEAHAHGLVHRDVKPANILVDDADHSYLGDFGLARHAASVGSLTGEHGFVGTLAYVSPEQIKGEEIDGRADVYSLGCVLYECLAGAPPFDRESELAVVYAHLNERTPRLSDVRPELPEGLDHVIRKATAKEPAERFASCAELIAAARGALAGERVPRRRRSAVLAVGALAVAAAIAVVVVLIAGGSDSPSRPRPLAVGGAGFALVDARTHRVAARIPLPDVPDDVVFDGGSAWALLRGAQRVVQIDVARRKQVGEVKLPFVPGGLAAARGVLFVTETGGPGLVRVDSRTRKITATWMVPARGVGVSDPTGIAAGAGSVWLARAADVVRVDASNGRVQKRYGLPVTATLLTFANGQLWAASSQNGIVEKIDPATDRIVAHATVRGWVSALSIGGGSAWVALTPDDVVYRLDEDDASVQQQIAAGEGPESLSAGGGAVWVANARGQSLTRIDSRSGARTVVPVTGVPRLVRQVGGLLWTAADRAPPDLAPAESGPEVRVGVRDDGIELDSGFGPIPAASQLLYSTCAKLVNYPDAAGTAGQQLRPEVAAALPTISPDRRTYTFQIRPGLRFSPPSGAPVDAAAVKWTIERTLSAKAGPNPAGLHAAGDIVGARDYNAGRAREVRGIVAQGDRLTITLARPAGDLLSRLAMPLFCIVPSKTPDVGAARGPIPSAGPYYVRTQTAGETVLDRNPNYRGTRPRRPGRIVYLTGLPTARAVALAGGGQVDVVTWDYDAHGALAPGGSLDRRFSRGASPRYRIGGAPGVDLLAFNTRRPLFSDVRLRQAVNYALDRRALAAVFQERATDSYVPPAIQGGSSPPVYPLVGPDLTRARQLAPSRRPRKASVYVCGDPANLRIAAIVRANLKPLAIDVSVTQTDDCLRGPDPKAARSDILLVTRATPELDPAPFLEATLGNVPAFGSTGPVTWVDRAYAKRLDDARSLTGPSRLAAYARIEEDMLRGPAAFAAYGAFVSPEFFSARTGCRVIQGAYGVVDLGALCVRGS